jgi:late competence protein required for DNA uptake (superfamily II DNA/RNA helicase)
VSALFHQRCVIHQDREAAVRCPGCSRFYCRECVTEHLGRMVCAHCVAKSKVDPASRRSSLAAWGALSLTGFLFAWLVFYYLGMGLARIPASFHGGAP